MKKQRLLLLVFLFLSINAFSDSFKIINNEYMKGPEAWWKWNKGWATVTISSANLTHKSGGVYLLSENITIKASVKVDQNRSRDTAYCLNYQTSTNGSSWGTAKSIVRRETDEGSGTTSKTITISLPSNSQRYIRFIWEARDATSGGWERHDIKYPATIRLQRDDTAPATPTLISNDQEGVFNEIASEKSYFSIGAKPSFSVSNLLDSGTYQSGYKEYKLQISTSNSDQGYVGYDEDHIWNDSRYVRAISYDNFNHSTVSNPIHFELDGTSPVIDYNGTYSAEDFEDDKFSIKYLFNIEDNQSGFIATPDHHFLTPDNSEFDVPESPQSNIRKNVLDYNVTVENFLYDYIYNLTYRSKSAIDLVGNSIDIFEPIVIGRTRPPQTDGATPILISENGEIINRFILQVGKYFKHEAIGYKSIHIDFNSGKFEQVITVDPNTSYESLNEKFNIMTLEFPVEMEGLEYHGFLNSSISSLYRDGTKSTYIDQDGNSTSSLDFVLSVPNIPLSKNNDFSLDFIRDGETQISLDYDVTRVMQTLYSHDAFILKLSTDWGLTDKEGDTLLLEVTEVGKDAEEYEFDENGEISFLSGTNINSIRMVERFTDWEGEQSNYTNLNLSFIYDNANLEELGIVTTLIDDSFDEREKPLHTSAHGYFTWNADFTDLVTSKKSPFQYFTMFEYADYEGMEAGMTREAFNTYAENIQTPVDDGIFDNPEGYNFTLLPLEEGNSEELRNIGLLIQDYAGNQMFVTRKIHYDTVIPTALDPSGDIVRWFDPTDESLPRENLTYADYDNESRVLTLTLDNAYYSSSLLASGLDNCKITLPDAHEISHVSAIELGVDGDTKTTETISLILEEGFTADSPIIFNLTLTDYAGNSTVNPLIFYTPLYFETQTHSDFIVDTEVEWSEDESHYFEWEQKTFPGAELRVYRENLLLGLKDTFIFPHDTVNYELRGANRSGYEAHYPGTIIPFSRNGINNPPRITSYVAEGSYESSIDRVYTGPQNTYLINYRDYDATDILNLQWYVNGEVYGEPQELGSDIGEAVFSVSDFFPNLINEEIYELRFEITDSWMKDDIAEVGVPTIQTNRLIYDDTAPTLVYEYEKRQDFPYIYGDVHVNIVEEGAGLESRDMTFGPEGAILSDGSNREGFTHQVSQIPDGNDQRLHFRFVDKVGNVNDSAATAVFHKDSVPPVLEAVSLTGSSEYFSRPFIPVSLDWTDNLAGVNRVLYRFLEDGVVVKEGRTSLFGDITAQTSGSWDVSCALSDGVSEDGKAYELEIKILDNAGNGNDMEWKKLPGSVVLDQSAPQISIDGVLGLNESRGRYYYDGSSLVSLQHSTVDANVGSDTWYELIQESGNRSSSSLSSLFEGLSDGSNYGLRVASRDKAGNIGYSNTLEFLKDSEAPKSLSHVILNSGVLSPGSQLRFTFTAEDIHSGIEDFDLWIGKDVNGIEVPVISSLLPGRNIDGTLSLRYEEGKIYSINLPDAENGNYYMKASARDKAGNTTALYTLGGETIHLATDSEGLTVGDYAAYSNDPNLLKGVWKYDGEKVLNHFSYRIISASDDNAVSDWQTSFLPYGSVSFATALEEGTRYYFETYARFEDGSRSTSRFSPGTYIDYSAPLVESTALPEAGPLSGLKLSWEASDSMSAIVLAEVAVDVYMTDIHGDFILEDGLGGVIPVKERLGLYTLESFDTAESVSVMNPEMIKVLDVEDGQRLLVSLRLGDEAGNIIESVVGVFVKDDSAPPIPSVIDSGDFINPDKLAHGPLNFNWMWSTVDSHSGEGSFYYQLINQNDELNEDKWIQSDEKRLSLDSLADYENGSTLILAVKSVNGAGLASVGYSNGITLDNTKPAVAEVRLNSSSGEEAYYLLSRDAFLSLQSEDEESGVSRYEYEAGTFVGSDWISLGDIKESYAGDGELSITLPEGIEIPTVVYYRATAYNTVGDPSSLPGYSSGTLYYEDMAMISNLVGESRSGSLVFSWKSADILPVSIIRYELKKSGLTFKQGELDGKERNIRFDSLEDGSYQLVLNYDTEDGQTGDESLSSSIITLDTTAPASEGLYYDHYVSELFNYQFTIRDNLSGAAGYRYQMGPVGSPDLLSQGWRSVNLDGAFENRTLSLADDLNDASTTVPDGGTMLFSLQLQDKSGNWSPVMTSDPVLVDRTNPELPVLGRNRELEINGEIYEQSTQFLYLSDSIDKLSLDALDNQSGINGYIWALKKGNGTEIPNSTWSDLVTFESAPGITALNLSDHSIPGVVLEDGEEYRLFVKVVNKAGLYSDAAISEVFIADLNAPEAVFDLSSGLDFKDGFLVFNSGGDVHIDINSEAGDVLYFDYQFIGDNGYESLPVSQTFLGDGHSRLTAQFVPSSPEAYGIYTIIVDLTDAGGRSRRFSQDLRLNAPPTFFATDVVTNPMKPFNIPLSSWIDDTDGVASYEIVIHYKGSDESYALLAGDDLTGLTYDHSNLYAESSQIPFTVISADSYGQSSSSESVFTIVNTQEGTLFTNEYWTGTHQMTGEVIVPDGLSLNLAAGTEVQIIQPEDGGKDPSLIIEKEASLLHEGTAAYSLFDPTIDYCWKGIEIFGTAVLDNITIRDAIRGLSLIGANVPSMSGIHLENNETGLHLWNSTPQITGSSFTSNLYYGVKEDAGASPTMIGNQFSANGFDYYDTDLTVITADTLNTLPGNSGNWGDN